MALRLPIPPNRYDPDYERRRNLALESADTLNQKKNVSFDVAGQASGNGQTLYLYSPNGSRWSISVSNAGAIVVTAA
jgi:hypothetical protein